MNRKILKLALPNIVSNVSVPLLGMVDVAIMGHLDNVSYLGAIALGGMIFNVLYMVFGFLRMGTTGFTSQAVGAKNSKAISLTLGRGFMVALSCAIFFIVFQIPIEYISFKILDGSPGVEALAANYFRIRIWAAPATISLYVIMGWYIGLQNTVIPMIIAISINIINLVLNLFFVLVLDMTSDGVALGTLFAQYSGLLIAAIFYIKKYHKKYPLNFTIKSLIDREELTKFLKVNRDIFIRTLLLIVSISFFTAQSAKQGDNILATNTILLQFFLFFSFFIDGFANAAEALTGKYFGAGDRIKLVKMVKNIFVWGGAIAGAFSLVYLFFGENIVEILTDNKDVISLSRNYFIWIILIPIFSFAAFVWDGVYVGATASVPMRNSMIIASLIIYFPLWYFLQPFGNTGLWIAFLCFLASRWILLTLFSKRFIFIAS